MLSLIQHPPEQRYRLIRYFGFLANRINYVQYVFGLFSP
ncbi:hypothetical protein LDG_5462 [Legionella drancourtii LLAP12]|uniref:Uncharacterized protein n=1 Tax=Legionella drancourtii LLAP12 TaxID=658187 RepID=G9EJU6_9GAMM|nr:hypothetical protein LDG_5462 [Legionella drancourtii LLAP12]